MLKLKFSREDKKMDSGGWVLNYDYLIGIKKKLANISEDFEGLSLDEIEAVLLLSIGEDDLLIETVKKLS